jgi:uncharacterized protein
MDETMIALRLLFLFLILALHACSVPVSRPEVPKAPDQQALTLIQQSDYVGAARVYLALASNTTETLKRGDYHMSAVEWLLRANQIQDAKLNLASLQQYADVTLRWRILLAQAEIDNAEGRAQDALARLANVRDTPIPVSLHTRYYSAQATALEIQQNYEAAARLRALHLDPLLRTPQERELNHRAIWRNLQPLSLEQLNRNSDNATWNGWLALGLLLKTTQTQFQEPALNSWRQRFPQHPANHTIAASERSETRLNVSDGSAAPSTSPYPQQPGHQGFKPHIALLLPLSGKLKRHSEAVRDGFMAAWYADGQRSAIRVYDTNTADLNDIYRQALHNGAAAIAGPLDKEEVLRLMQILAGQPAPVPILALNVLDSSILNSTTMPPNFYQFSLAPEDEALDAALWAWQDGHRNAAILVPANDWGQRMSNAFYSQWQALGGQIVENRTYENNFGAPIKAIVSHKNYLDMVFIAAYPAEGRQIKPQFRFYLAGNIPLYASSHIYSGIPDSSQDRDIDGVRFVEMPWRIKSMSTASAPSTDLYPQLSTQWPDRYGNRLLAFGIDAYHVTQRLPLSNNGQTILNGESGVLAPNRQGIVQRRLLRAWFNKGLPQALNALDTAPIQEAPLPNADYSQR